MKIKKKIKMENQFHHTWTACHQNDPRAEPTHTPAAPPSPTSGGSNELKGIVAAVISIFW